MPSCLAKAVTRCRILFPRRVKCRVPGTLLGRVRIGTPPTTTSQGGNTMRQLITAMCLSSVAVFATGAASANEELARLQKDPKQWVIPAGDFANTRYSALKQITADNVGKLQVAWTFSTGVLRGHEGNPLVVGDTMYLHTPFPNIVYALNLKDENKIIWK